MSSAPVPAATPRRRALEDNEETRARLGELGALLCTPEEAALIMKVSEIRMKRFLARSAKARRAYDEGRGQAIEALRRAQLKLAETNATMAIFLGKNYLGQADRREVEQSGAIDLSHASQRVRDKLAALADEWSEEGDRESRAAAE